MFGISVLRSEEENLKNLSQNFGKIALCGVVGSERKTRGFGILPNKLKCDAFYGKETNYQRRANHLYQELPKHEVIRFKWLTGAFSGRGLYTLAATISPRTSPKPLPQKEKKRKKEIRKTLFLTAKVCYNKVQ